MTPQERKLIDELFDRLASLENGPRDAGAVGAIKDGLARAPNALYPLVQTALVQDEALKRADARIRELEQELELEPGEPVNQPGFLDTMRDALLGKPHGSVPTVRPAPAGSPWGNMAGQPSRYADPPQAQGQPYAQAPASSGGSFLGTAAATAAGVVGGALLMNSFRGMFGGHNPGQSAFDAGGGSGAPWGSNASGSELARDAGLDDVGHGGRSASDGDGSQRAGLFDSPGDDSTLDPGGGDVDVGGDFGGDGGGDSA